ncbi:uncharacterized protein [Populus alba]|uniref:uncharacterized protein n=1 Tax=Populus alba TaxID=43335 RepID=UPI003CC77DC7
MIEFKVQSFNFTPTQVVELIPTAIPLKGKKNLMEDQFKIDDADDNFRICNMQEGEPNFNQRLGSILLNEFNYLSWSRAVTIALGGRSKIGYINGHITPPDSSSQALLKYSATQNPLWHLWEAVKEMYGNQNNIARIFQINKNLANLQQDDKTYVQLLGTLKGMWSELALYRPHTIDAVELPKREEEDKIFQLLASLGPDYEDLRSRILMNPDLPSLTTINEQQQTLQGQMARFEMSPLP